MTALLLALLLATQAPGSDGATPHSRGEGPPEPARERGTSIAAATPEEASRTFLIAMMLKDESTLRAVTLTTDDFDWLLRGQMVPEDQADAMKAYFARMPMRALKPGDEISLPGGRSVTVRPEEVTADRAVIQPEGAPIPNRLRKVDGRWRLDATPIISARKAADAARKRREPSGP